MARAKRPSNRFSTQGKDRSFKGVVEGVGASDAFGNSAVPGLRGEGCRPLQRDGQAGRAKPVRLARHLFTRSILSPLGWAESSPAVRCCRIRSSLTSDVAHAGQVTGVGPTLGKHTFEVLHELLGYDTETIVDLAAAEILE